MLLQLLLIIAAASAEWTKISDNIDRNHKQSFTLFLNWKNTDKVFDLVRDVSNPSSKNYGNYLTKESIAQILRPNHNVTYLMRYLGTNYCKDHRLAIRCTMPIRRIEYLFTTRFSLYSNFVKEKFAYKAESYWISKKMQRDVNFILGIMDLPETDNIVPKYGLLGDDYVITRESLYSLYNMTDEPQNEASTQAVIEYQDTCFNMQDFIRFQNSSGMKEIMSNVTIYGPCDTADPEPDIEATLDIQYQCALGNCKQQQYISSGGWLLDGLMMTFSLDKSPLVISYSYGWWEMNQDQWDGGIGSEEYVGHCNLLFAVLALNGTTNVVASGDSGALTRTNLECTEVPHLRAEYPGSSPYIVSVGGTIYFNVTKTGGTSDMCKNSKCVYDADEVNTQNDNSGWCSGSGIANYSQREYWSLKENANYLSDVWAPFLPNPSEYNPLGRQYPDVAMMAHNYMIVAGNQYGTVDGTSCSAPAFSGLMVRLNSIRLNNGCPPLGLAGPFLYKMYEECPNCYVDLVEGCSNSTEEMDCPPEIKAYCATVGYDTIYGMGLPNYGRMAEYTLGQCQQYKLRNGNVEHVDL